MIGPAGQWLGASIVLGRPVQVTERYPHICGVSLTGTMTGVFVRLRSKECATCAEQGAKSQAAGR